MGSVRIVDAGDKQISHLVLKKKVGDKPAVQVEVNKRLLDGSVRDYPVNPIA
jgi:hypothetical protein